ncbi:MAG: Stp1/IreP family PP2C-type Ser/Thr phosphatase [Chitinophagaceae bacterium]|nr:MAG: Stp1/IreP family PP2C-type Ser/Thr phosphatase [Chitinophagaceae bacterium]
MFQWFTSSKETLAIKSFKHTVALSNMVATVVSDIGNVRKNNEDAASIFIPENKKELNKKGTLLLLADGMGGHNSGEVASELALKTISHDYYNKNSSVKNAIKTAFTNANSVIYDTALNEVIYKGMGTTCTAIVIQDENIYMGHVGDSRVYFFNESESKQISKDHTLVQFKIEQGEINPEDAETHPERNVLTNAMGTKPFIEADFVKIPYKWRENSVILICSDGLYEYVKIKEMTQLVSTISNIDILASKFIEMAKTRGGHDNITVVIASFNGQINYKDTKDTSPD